VPLRYTEADFEDDPAAHREVGIFGDWMIVVAERSPLHYLILLEQAEVLWDAWRDRACHAGHAMQV
jgi:hypothetical protein